jgi:hypothetical protein
MSLNDCSPSFIAMRIPLEVAEVVTDPIARQLSNMNAIQLNQ